MALDKKLFKPVEAAAPAPSGSGNQEEGLLMYVDANDVDSFDGAGDASTWYDITNHEYTPSVNPEEHFNTVTYSGTGTTNAITGLGFQPDLVWIKRRNSAVSHYHFNSVVGDGKYFYTDANNAAITSSESNLFNSDGFTLANSVLGNNSAGTYVAWCMKAGGAPTATNTATSGAMTANSVSIDGQLKSAYTPSGSPEQYPNKISANTKLGFSIVTYDAELTSTQSAPGHSLPHGLNQPPEMIIWKNIDAAHDWWVAHEGLGGFATLMKLNTNATPLNYESAYPMSKPTADVFYTNYITGMQHVAGQEIQAYCFHSVRGVSRVGSYTGTGSTTKVYTGFEPAFVMVKRTDSTSDWVIYDNKRGGTKLLFPYLQNAEGTYTATYNLEFNRDGFSISSGYAVSGGKYIYLAFAKNTKETSLIDDTDLVMHLDAGDDDSYNGSGSTWSDLANSNDATITGASWDKELGNWFDFDGTNDEMTFSSSTALTTRTIEFWYYSSDLTNNYWTFDSMPQFGSANSFGVWSIYISPDYIYFIGAKWNGSTYGGYQGSNTMKQNKWHHIAFSCSNGNYKGYVDGELISDTNSQYYVTSRNVDSVTLSNVNFMGTRSGYTGGTYFAEGKLGQIRIYDTVLTQNQIRQNYNFTKNDYPNGHNGTLVSSASPSFSTDHFDFVRGSISGGSDQVVFSSNFHNLIKSTSEGTITAWIKVDAVAGRCSIFGTGHTSDNNDWAVFRTTTSRTLQFSINNGGTANGFFTTSTSEITTGSYIHVAMSVDINGIGKMYINGVSQAVSYQTGSSTQWFSDVGTNTVTIGSFDRGSSGQLYDGFDGEISQVKFYDRVLTDQEISDQHTAGR